MAQIDSSSDNRTANNTVRHKYRTLTDAEKAQMDEIKNMGAAFIAKLYEIAGLPKVTDNLPYRDLALAQTHAEDAVMRAVRHITS